MMILSKLEVYAQQMNVNGLISKCVLSKKEVYILSQVINSTVTLSTFSTLS